MKTKDLIKNGFSRLAARDVERFIELRRAAHEASWGQVAETADGDGRIDAEDPAPYAAQIARTEAGATCRAWFDALAPEARFELLALSSFRKYGHEKKHAWRDAVREAEVAWRTHETGERRMLPSASDAADEILMCFEPDLENMSWALSVLLQRQIIRD